MEKLLKPPIDRGSLLVNLAVVFSHFDRVL